MRMGGFRDLPLKGKLTLLLVATTVIVLLVACAAVFAYDYLAFRRDTLRDAEVLAGTVEFATAAQIVFSDRETARENLRSLRGQPAIISVAVYDGERRLFASFLRAGALPPPSLLGKDVPARDFSRENLVVSRRITFDGHAIGTILLTWDLAEGRARLQRYGLTLSLVMLVGTGLAFLLALRLQRLVSEPILHLLEVEKQVSEKGDFTLRATKTSNDELGLLIEGFNEMLEQIRARDEKLTIAKERAEEANHTKSAFLANMSHELRTPLNAIIGYAEMLQEDAREEGVPRWIGDLEKIRGSGKHLLGLINDILDLSKIEAGKMDVSLDIFDVGQLVARLRETSDPLMKKNGNKFAVVGAESAGVMRSDETKVFQVLLNLVSNAAKFTKDGVVTLEVTKARTGETDTLAFAVTDSGIGLTDSQIAKLFTPFTQGDSSTTRRYGGTGLGLTISKRFTQMLGGDITVKSAPGQGSTFTAVFPVNVVKRKRDSSSSTMIIPAPGSPVGTMSSATLFGRRTPSPAAAARLVLVVDDDPVTRELTSTIVGREGFRVEMASSGPEALDKARFFMPDVITLDVMMPGMDGWTVLANLKQHPTLSKIPVIMLTIVDDRKLGYALGAADFVLKPVERERLANALRKY
ncbi:MAG: response regulator, partial [Acidobacteria bacterium]|nr:response regulator [Acidobacteriota bacterium]